MNNNLYSILKLDSNATLDQIKDSYNKLKDIYTKNNDNTNLYNLYESYNILSDKQNKILYDSGILFVDLDQSSRSQKGNLLFENKHFANFLKESKKANIKKANDLHINVEISLAEAFQGCKKRIEHILKVPCQKCVDVCNNCKGSKIIKSNKMVVQGFYREAEDKCQFCHELGYVYNKYSNIQCSKCHGNKKTFEMVEELIETPPLKTVCANCNGTKIYTKKINIPISKKIQCPDCQGNKHHTRREKVSGAMYKIINDPCITCDQKGFVLKQLKSNAFMTKTEMTNCNECNQDGYILEATTIEKVKREKIVRCNKCNASGYEIIPKEYCTNCELKYYTNNHKIFYLNLFPGIEQGHMFRIKNAGEQILNGSSGDLIITINIRNNKLYTRINENLKVALTIHFVKTITGALYKLILPSNEVLIIDTKMFNEVVNPMKIYCYKNMGMPLYNFETKEIISYGDLYIQFNIIYGKIRNISNQVVSDFEKLFAGIYDTVDDDESIKIKVIDASTI